LVKKHDRWVISGFDFTLVYEVVEAYAMLASVRLLGLEALTLSLLQHLHVFSILMWQTPHEAVRVESIEHSSFLLVLRGRCEKLSIGVKERCKASSEGGPNLFGMKGGRTNNAYLLRTPAVSNDPTSSASVDSVLRLIIAYCTHRPVIVKPPLQAMTFRPVGSFIVPNGLHQHAWHYC